MPARMWSMTKIAAGDYLLPSNDRKTMWRITVYEDGPSHGVESMKRDKKFWGVWRWTGPPRSIDTTEWHLWEMFDSGYESRREAIDAALKMGGA